MMCKATVAVCTEILTKLSTKSEHHLEFFNINHLTPKWPYRTAKLQMLHFLFIQQIYVLNILNMLHTLCFFPLQNAVCFIMLPFLVPVLFTFYIQVC